MAPREGGSAGLAYWSCPRKEVPFLPPLPSQDGSTPSSYPPHPHTGQPCFSPQLPRRSQASRHSVRGSSWLEALVSRFQVLAFLCVKQNFQFVLKNSSPAARRASGWSRLGVDRSLSFPIMILLTLIASLSRLQASMFSASSDSSQGPPPWAPHRLFNWGRGCWRPQSRNCIC